MTSQFQVLALMSWKITRLPLERRSLRPGNLIILKLFSLSTTSSESERLQETASTQRAKPRVQVLIKRRTSTKKARHVWSNARLLSQKPEIMLFRLGTSKRQPLSLNEDIPGPGSYQLKGGAFGGPKVTHHPKKFYAKHSVVLVHHVQSPRWLECKRRDPWTRQLYSRLNVL